MPLVWHLQAHLLRALIITYRQPLINGVFLNSEKYYCMQMTCKQSKININKIPREISKKLQPYCIIYVFFFSVIFFQ